MARLSPRLKHLSLFAVLLAIFALALAVRLYGVNFGLPYAEEVDEPAIMDHAIAMLTRGDWNPHWFLYPTFYIYAQSLITWLYFQWAQAQGLLSSLDQISGLDYNLHYIPQPDLYLWARTLAALVGASTTLVLYGAAARLYSRVVGLAAAAILAFTFLHVQYSHYIRTDIPLTFFITLTLLFAARLLRHGSVLDYVLAGVGIGLTVASKYNGFLVALVVTAAHLARVRRQSPDGRDWINFKPHGLLLLSSVASLAAFFVTNPFALLDWNTFWFGVHDDAQTYSYTGLQLANAVYYVGYFQQRGGLGALLTPLAWVGTAMAIVRRRGEDVIAAIFPLAYFVFLLFWDKANIRSALPLTPFLALFAGLALARGAEFLAARWKKVERFRWTALTTALVLLLLAPADKILSEDARMSRPTTRALATNWAEANLPRGARILSEPDGVRVSTGIQLPSESLTPLRVEKLQASGLDFVVAADDPFTASRTLDPSLALVQTFPSSDPAGGPTIRIFQVPPRPLGLELVDAHFERDQYAPGERAVLTLYWRVLENLSENDVEFVRLIAPSGESAFEFSEMPQGGNGRTRRWSAGKTITDTHSFVLADSLEPDRYRVQVGFYRERTEFALPLRAADDRIVRALDIGTLKVARPLAPTDGAMPTKTLDARFGGVIRLNGFSLNEPTIAPGTTVELQLHWSALREMQTSYTRFVHLVDSQGRLVTQVDSLPLDGNYPTSVWDVDEPVADLVRLKLPQSIAPGTYALQVGWYGYPSLQRLRTGQGDDKVVLQSINVR